MDLELRTNTDPSFDTDTWLQAVHNGFLYPGALEEEFRAAHRAEVVTSRTAGVFRGERCVATLRSFDQRLTVPGGVDLAAHAVTAVTVSADHRRRGLLRRMLTADLRQAKEHGQALASLIAMEYQIYGGFGFGPAADMATFEVDGPRAGVPHSWTLPESEGTLRYADGAEIRRLGPELHERFRLRRPGVVDRSASWWRGLTGDLRFAPDWREPFYVLHRDTSGTVQGLAAYHLEQRAASGMPSGTVTVNSLTAATPTSERALWRFLLSLDLMVRLVAPKQAPDSLLPDLLPEPRAAQPTTVKDFLWLRPLDVPAMLERRGYRAEDELVLEVTDPMGLANGRFLLSAGPDGASCAPTTRSADLTLDAAGLARLYLGDRPASRLAALGQLSEERPGAVARADVLLLGSERAWTPDVF